MSRGVVEFDLELDAEIPIGLHSTHDEIHEAAIAVVRFAESLSSAPGFAATLLVHAVAALAYYQTKPRAAMAVQIEYLQGALDRLPRFAEVES